MATPTCHRACFRIVSEHGGPVQDKLNYRGYIYIIIYITIYNYIYNYIYIYNPLMTLIILIRMALEVIIEKIDPENLPPSNSWPWPPLAAWARPRHCWRAPGPGRSACASSARRRSPRRRPTPGEAGWILFFLGIPLGFWRWWSVSGLGWREQTKRYKKIKDGMLDVHGIF